MKTYLPHTFKKVGIIFVFIAILLSSLGGIDDFRQGFDDGFNNRPLSSNENYSVHHPDVTIVSYFTDKQENTFILISLLFSVTGFFLYLFSKEKIDNKYIQQIRLKSIFQSLLISWLIYGIVKLLFTRYELDGIFILQLQLLVYVIIFSHNKNIKVPIETIK